MEFFEKHIRDGNTLETWRTQIVSYTPEGYEILVPKDEGNTEYKQYLAWVAKGNKPKIVYNDSEYHAKYHPENPH